MGWLAGFSGREVVRAAERAGWILVRQTGSHMVLEHPDRPRSIVVPNHRDIDPGTLRGIIRDMGLTVEQFRKLAGR